MELLARDYDVKLLCSLMGVSRSGYYKWKGRKPSPREVSREKAIELVRKTHEAHPTHGYRWVAAYIRANEGMDLSDNYAYKCFNFIGIKSETRHKPHYRPRKVKDRYPNLILTTWDTVDRPRQVIVSDMTAFKVLYMYFEVTMYFDVFTKEMLSWRLAERRGAREQYIGGLEDVVGLLRGNDGPTVLHTDQGSVYASMAYNEIIRDTNIVRSMSRAGKPTDNPVNEALNGWIKEELMIDFKLNGCTTREQVKGILEDYKDYYNEKRPCYAIGYDTPANYRRRFHRGELPQKNTFRDRVLTDKPKFVQKRLENAHAQENANNV